MEKGNVIDQETEEEIARVKRLARKTHDAKQRRRYDIIRLYLSKRTKPDIAEILDISLTQVYLILNLYKEAGIEGLTLKQPRAYENVTAAAYNTQVQTDKTIATLSAFARCLWQRTRGTSKYLA